MLFLGYIQDFKFNFGQHNKIQHNLFFGIKLSQTLRVIIVVFEAS